MRRSWRWRWDRFFFLTPETLLLLLLLLRLRERDEITPGEGRDGPPTHTQILNGYLSTIFAHYIGHNNSCESFSKGGMVYALLRLSEGGVASVSVAISLLCPRE